MSKPNEIPSFVIENYILKGKELEFKPEEINLLEILKKNPNFIGQIDAETGESATYKRLADESVRCAIWLKKQTIGPGDIVTIITHNTISSWAPFLAVNYIGANLNPWYQEWTSHEISYAFNYVQPKIIFANEKCGKMVNEVLKTKKVNTKIIVFGKVSGLESFDNIIKLQGSEEVSNFQSQPLNPNDDAWLIFTSGTSGIPKAVQLSYAGSYRNAHYRSVQTLSRKKMIVSFYPSLSWISGCIYVLLCILKNCTAVNINDLSPEDLCRLIEKHKIQWVFMSSNILDRLKKSDLLTKYNLASLNLIDSGGSNVALNTLKNINQVLPNAKILQIYGLTELGGAVTIQVNSNANNASIGNIIPNVQLKVVDINSGEILKINQKGELCFKHPYMMKCYFNNPKATEKMIDSEGWLHTGDFGYFDEKGIIYKVDRINDLIKYKNHLVTPSEIEQILKDHPDVTDAAVIGVPHELDGQHPMAFVTKVTNSKVSEKDLLKIVDVLDDRKKLRGGIKFLEKMPYTFTGKVHKANLK